MILLASCGNDAGSTGGSQATKADTKDDTALVTDVGADASDAAAGDTAVGDAAGEDVVDAAAADADTATGADASDGADDASEDAEDGEDGQDGTVILPDLPIWPDTATSDVEEDAGDDQTDTAPPADIAQLDAASPDATVDAATDTPDAVPDSATDDAGPGDAGGQSDAKPYTPPPANWQSVCFYCHGDANRNDPAPPIDLLGFADPSQHGVGAHSSHTGVAGWHKTVACSECHKVPKKFPDPDTPTHLNATTDLNWGPLAQQGSYNFSDLACSGNYCHGATLKPDVAGQTSVRKPKWTTVDGSQEACGTACHTNPPGGSHPADSACANCHTAALKSYDPATKIAVWQNADLHINGKVEVEKGVDCTSCHGDPATKNPAPPQGLAGQNKTTDKAVGAHTQHLSTSTWHRTVACSDCHVVPTEIPHASGTVDLQWSPVAAANSATPVWDEQLATCASSWCHSAGTSAPKSGALASTKPVWTKVDGSQAACGSNCHTNPPGGVHPKSQLCQNCHGSVIASFDAAAQGAQWVDASLHINGKVDVAGLTCTSCHGDQASNNPAPPKGTQGQTATADPAVGAHAQHLGKSDWHRDGACSDCHSVPSDLLHANDQIELVWGSVPATGSAKPSFSVDQLTCSGNYCHGATLLPAKTGGATLRQPKWTTVDGSQAQCGATCHTNPPGGDHVANTACATCHGTVIQSYDPKTGAAKWANPGLHINGKLDLAPMTCTTCHGDTVSNNPAPPKGTKGETATTSRAVGAHAAHLTASASHRDVACGDCHTVPSNVLHSNDQVELAWSSLVKTGGAAPSWDTSELTCSGGYCHGATLGPAKTGGAKLTSPAWIAVDGSQAKCGSTCHTNPPGGSHTTAENCQVCHGAVIKAWDPQTGAATWNNGKLHVNGVLEAAKVTCTACHGDANSNNPAPPKGTNGETATTAPAVGAHAAHLGTSTWHRDGQCTDCHALPTATNHANGLLDLTWGALPQTAGASTKFDPTALTCSGSYCHGATLSDAKVGGTKLTAPKWTQVDGSQAQCGATCHTNPPGGNHTPNTACGTCHADVIKSFDPSTGQATWAKAALHINGKVEVAGMDCTTCHGNATTQDPAPPKGTQGETATTTRAVGAHTAHLTAADWHRDTACNDCHVVPSSNLHSDNTVQVAFGALAKTAGAQPSWDTTKLVCSGGYCHGATLPAAAAGGTTLTAPLWTKVDGSQTQCGSTCHTNPPGGSHVQSSNCAVCHGAVIKAWDAKTGVATWQDGKLHVNGKVEQTKPTCTSCHGDATTKNPAPPLGTKGETATTAAAVGAHAQHLASGTWHRSGQCQDCHSVPTSQYHADGKLDLTPTDLSQTGATTAFDGSALTCTGSYCHGATLAPAKSGGATNRTPTWNKVDGSQVACGTTCHTNPPGGAHPKQDNCAMCHTAVVKSYDPQKVAAVWNDASLHVNGKVDVAQLQCTSCHGDPVTNNAAPPLGTLGQTQTTQKAVGAHQMHLGANGWHRAGQCGDCHSVPSSMTHTDSKVDLAWGSLATASGATADWDGTATTCSGNYCHGNTLAPAKQGGQILRSPNWTKVDGSQDACGTTCHTNPPGGSHPQQNNCALCHDAVVSTYDAANAKATWKDPLLHINGKVELRTLDCTSCHGDPASKNPAPPADSLGNSATTAAGVGAHGVHLAASSWHRAGQCTDCHTVPTSTLHTNGQRDLTWGSVATADKAQPSYDDGALTCSGAYCHGSTLPPAKSGGSIARQPVWNLVDGTQAQCGSTCHTNPPGGSHPQLSQCATCHPAVVSSFDPATNKTTWKDPALHVNGSVEVVKLTCTTCHGDSQANNPAPPLGTKGETATTTKAVGAHAQHGGSSTWHRDVACGDCHSVPTTVTHSNGAVDLAWSSVASAASANPAWTSSTTTCAGTYCHGSTLLGAKSGGTLMRTPNWTKVDGTQAACGTTCHTLPPGGTHPQNTQCATCHTTVIASNDPATTPVQWADRTLHIDGKIDVGTLTCTSCHGDKKTNNPAPPIGTKGETATTTVAVGAHAQHLGASNSHRAGQCNDCHVVPVSLQHGNGTAELTWGSLAKTGSQTPAWDANTANCSTTYCHGSSLEPATSGASVMRTPKWTKVDGSQAACGSTCHTNPPGGNHPSHNRCEMCHSAVITSYDAAKATAVWNDAALHVDGKLQLTSLTCTSCHGDVSSNDPMPPKGTQGETQTSEPAVGAHQKHIGTSAWHRAGSCDDCHTLPTSVTHANSVLDLVWGTVATAGSAKPAFDSKTVTCSGTWCHGSQLYGPKSGGSTLTAPKWTTVDGSQTACGSTCHTNPPGGKHPQSSACSMCHANVVSSYDAQNNTVVWKNADLHIDGTVDVIGMSCTSCHGDADSNNPAPPKGVAGETKTSQVAVGAHAQHLQASTWHLDVQCTACHSVPKSMTHTDGTVDMAFGDVALASGATPTWDKATVTCNGAYCHGATLPPAKQGGSVNHSPLWTKVDGSQAACGSTCHTNPPGGTHPQNSNCALCHAEVLNAYAETPTLSVTWADPAKHIDGKVEVKTLTCTTCHGDAKTNNPAPPLGTKGETQTSQAAVGAHTAHTSTSDWHRNGQCSDCHVVPDAVGHSNGSVDLDWGGPAANGGAKPDFDATKLTCASTYCHGTTLLGPIAGGTVNRTPVWNVVNGSWDACGTTCHTLPPAAPHPPNNNCAQCHDAVIKSFTPGTPPTVVWKDAQLHIDGKIDTGNVTCTSCHGDKGTNNPAPPLGTNGETATTAAAVGAHQQHLGTSTWHRDGLCVDCHTVPASTSHSNGQVEVSFGDPGTAGGLKPKLESDVTCSNTWCHGAGLGAAKSGGTLNRTPLWTQVDGSQDACGTTCHTNPPGGSHVAHTDCSICHAAVVQAFNPANNATTWQDRALHVNGVKESNKYHNLSGWTTPKFGTNHHGSNYFMRNQQRDEHNVSCTQCHGADLLGGTVGVSCSNSSCHGGDWKSCDFCHGTKGGSSAPPIGVANEGATATNTLAVGRHDAHLTASTTHVAFACTICHTVPATGDVAHAMQYVYSADLTTTGHHGDVTFAGGTANGMTFAVTATTGTPPTGRGTCVGTCHSNGRGGNPVTTPYWAGGTWTKGSCGTCHSASPSTYRHSLHINDQKLTCVNCHPAASSSSHLNGVRDTLTAIAPSAGNGTGSVTSSPPSGTCTTPRCTGTCHGKGHSNLCWSN